MSVNLHKPNTPQFFIQNLKVLLDLIVALPAERLELGSYKVTYECGSHYCVAGWVAIMPHFQALGVKANGYNAPHMPGYDWGGITQTLSYLFGRFNGQDAFDVLCETYGNGYWDRELNPHNTLSDHNLAIMRLDKAIKYHTKQLHTDSGENHVS